MAERLKHLKWLKVGRCTIPNLFIKTLKKGIKEMQIETERLDRVLEHEIGKIILCTYTYTRIA